METSDAEPVKAVEKQKPKESGDAEGRFIWLIQKCESFLEEMAPKSGEKRKKTSGTRRATTKKTRKAWIVIVTCWELNKSLKL
jgi:hypothetical protein